MLVRKVDLNKSKEIMDEFVQNSCVEFLQAYIQSYLRIFSGFSKWLSRIDKYLFKIGL